MHQKTKNRTTMWSSNPTPGHLSRENHDSQRHMYSDVHCSMIFNSQDVETTQMSIDRGVDKEEAVHIHNGILLSHQKERNKGNFSNMVGPRNYHARWSQPYNEIPTSNAFTDMWNLKNGQNELLCRTDTDSQTLKTYGFQRREFGGWEDVLGLWDGNPIKLDCGDHCTTINVMNSLSNI